MSQSCNVFLIITGQYHKLQGFFNQYINGFIFINYSLNKFYLYQEQTSLMSLYQSINLNELKQTQNIFKTYTYVVFGPERVGKTNIITRFVKDQFTEAHNMTLEGQQSSIVSIDNRKFQILVHDTAGKCLLKCQQNLCSMKAVWRGHKDGYIFVYAIDNKQTFEDLLEDIRSVKENQIYKNVPALVIGNKQDLRNSRQVDKRWAQNQIKKFNLKHFQISAKSSPRQEIQKIFTELVLMNQMNLYSDIISQNPRNIKYRKKNTNWMCCQSDDFQSKQNQTSLVFLNILQ